MSTDDPEKLAERVRQALHAATSAAECLSLAAESDSIENLELKRECLQRAVALDRSSQDALLNLAALSLDEGDATSTYCLVEEAARIAPLPPEVQPLHDQLLSTAAQDPNLEPYLQAIGKHSGHPADETLSVLLIDPTLSSETDQSPGLCTDDLAQLLAQRGHAVRILTSDTAATDSDHSRSARIQILRTLQPVGSGEQANALERTRDNAARVRTAVTKSEVDIVLVSELSGLDIGVLQPALERGIPVIHFTSGIRPGFPVDAQPTDAHYAIAPTSDWAGTALRNAGYETAKMDTLYPGIRTDRWFRLFLPDIQALRVCFTGPLGASSGGDLLLSALGHLKQQAVVFSATFATNSGDTDEARRFEARVKELGLESSVVVEADASSDRTGLLARHNVLVHANTAPEAFPAFLAEAMASGVIVVSNGLGGAKEIVRDEVDGLVFRPGDAADLAAKLAGLLPDGERFGRLQRAAQSRAMQFSAEETAKRFETLARELIEARRLTDLQEPDDLEQGL